MSTYLYSYEDSDGAIKHNKVRAKTLDDAREKLIYQNIYPISVQEKSLLTHFSANIFKGVSLNQLLLFSKLLYTMINSGIMFIRALELISKQMKNKYFVKILKEIIYDMQSGHSISQSFKRHEKIFGKTYCFMLEAGESSGRLEIFLANIETLLERQQTIRRNIKSAMFYPGFLLAAAIGMSLIVMLFVVPKFESIYASAGQNLPAVTQMVVDFSTRLAAPLFWVKFVGGSFLLVVLFTFLHRKSTTFAYVVDSALIKTPVVGSIVQYAIFSHVFTVFYYMLHFGVSITDILKILQKGSKNQVFKRSFQVIGQDLQNGESIENAFIAQPVFSIMIQQMITVGKESGHLERMIQKISDYYTQLFLVIVKNLNTVIEPVMILIIASLIGFLLFAMYMPIFNLGTTLL